MSIARRISDAEYQELALAGMVGQWELYDGQLRERPGMRWEHGRVVMLLARQLLLHLDSRHFELRINEGRVRGRGGNVYIPDLIVVPATLGELLGGQPGKLAIISSALPLVVEVWSLSTGAYDIDAKLPAYMQRGDREIWRIHPSEKTLTAWRRQPDGRYEETLQREGIVRPIALPDIAIDLAELFDEGDG